MASPEQRKMLDGYHSLTSGYRDRAHAAEARVAALEGTIRQIQKANADIADAGESYEAIEGLCRDAFRDDA